MYRVHRAPVLLRERLALASLFEGFCLRFAPDRHRVCAALAALVAHQIHAGPITFCAITSSMCLLLGLPAQMAANVRATHDSSNKYTQFQSVGIGGILNTSFRQYAQCRACGAPRCKPVTHAHEPPAPAPLPFHSSVFIEKEKLSYELYSSWNWFVSSLCLSSSLLTKYTLCPSCTPYWCLSLVLVLPTIQALRIPRP